TPTVKPANGSAARDLDDSSDHPDVVHRQPVCLVVEAPTVEQGEHLLSQRRGHRRLAAAVADDAAGHHRGATERVDVADRGQGAILAPMTKNRSARSMSSYEPVGPSA